MASVRNRISLVAQAAVGDPPDFSDVQSIARIQFAGTAKVFKDATPFLPWVASGPRKAPSAEVPFHLFEALMLSVCSFDDEAALLSVVDTCVSVDFLRDVLTRLVTDGLKIVIFHSFSDFTRAASRIASGSAKPDAFVVKKSDLWATEAPSGDCDSLDWLRATHWGHWFPTGLASEDRAFACSMLSLFGARAHTAPREAPDGRFSLLCEQFKTSYIAHNGSVPLPSVFLGPLIVNWLSAIQWPRAFVTLLTSDGAAFKEMRTLMTMSAGSAGDRSSLLKFHLPRALNLLSGLDSFLDGSISSSDADLLLPLLARLKLEAKHPSWSDFVALNEALLLRSEICLLVEPSPGAPLQRLTLLLDDFAAEQRSTKLRPTVFGPGSGEGDTLQALSAVSVDHAHAFNELRRSAPLLALTTKLESRLDAGILDRSKVFKLAFSSRISSVVRFFTGVLSSLDLHSVFARLSSMRVLKFKRDATALAPLGRYLGEAVANSVRAVLPDSHHRLSSFTLHHSTVFNLLFGLWHLVDWEQVLVFNVALVRSGKPAKTDNRKKDLWFTDESTLSDLVAPMTALLSAIGYAADPTVPNSFAAITSQIIQAYRVARMNEDCAPALVARAVESMHKALVDSAEGWSLYFLDSSPWANFPDSVLPSDSTCFLALQSSLKTSNAMIDLVADGFDSFLENLLSRKRGSPRDPAAPPSKKSKPLPPPGAPPLPPAGAPPLAIQPAAVQNADGKFVPFYLVDEDRDLLQISKSQLSLSKVKAHFGPGERCWAVAVTNKVDPNDACPCPGTVGHLPSDALHSITDAQRADFKKKRSSFNFKGNALP